MENLTKMQRGKLIGKKCRVSAIYIRKPKWPKIKIKERPGWVVGFGAIRRGESDYLGYDDGVIFRHIETIRVVKVRFWPTEQEKNVPFDSIIIDDSAKPYSSMSKYSEECKRAYIEQIELFPRDSNGRFVSVYQSKKEV